MLIYPLFCFFPSVHKRVQPIRSLLPYPALETSPASEFARQEQTHQLRSRAQRNPKLEYFQQTELLINTCSGSIKKGLNCALRFLPEEQTKLQLKFLSRDCILLTYTTKVAHIITFFLITMCLSTRARAVVSN